MNHQRPPTALSIALGLLLVGITLMGLSFVRQWRESGSTYYGEFLVGGAVLALLGVALLIRHNRS
jgi:putative copper export protein